MSSTPETPYTFAEGIPIDPVPPGTVVMVAGDTLGPMGDLARLLVTTGSDRGEGMLFISTKDTAEGLLDGCRELQPGIDESKLGIIDCSGQEMPEVQSPAQIKYISTQSDLTGIGMKFSSLYQSIYENADGGRLRTGLDTLSSLAMYVDIRTLFKFAQTMSSRIDSADGFGVFLIDPSAHDEQSINTLLQVVDGEIRVRGTDGDADGELRTRGLFGQSDDWRPFSLPTHDE